MATTPLWIQRLQFQYRLEGMVNGIDADLIPIFEIGLERISGKLVALESKADRSRTYQYKKKYLDAQKAELQKILKDVYTETGDLIKANAIELAMEMPAITAAMVERAGITIHLGMPNLNKQTVNAWFRSSQIQGTYFNTWLQKLEGNAVSRIVAEVREGKVLSESVSQVAKRIQNALDVSRRSARGLAHNSMHQAVTWSEREYWQENKDQIKGLRFIAELDRRTSPICRSLSERVFKVDEAPVPPLHWNCRSYLEPVGLGLSEEVRNRATKPARLETDPRTVHHRDGSTSTAYRGYDSIQVPAGMSHNQFMSMMVNSSNPEYRAFAKEALGPTRYGLVKSGKLKINQLYYGGKLRTIKDLRRLTS